ncbi:MAG: bifunctional metallophosphatase/5'-nucleotidase [Polyangiaceae bacterium]
MARGPWLRIVSVNDVYALDHLPKLRSLVEAARRDGPEVLLVTMAGDFLAPSTLSSIDAGAGMIDCMNRVPITHAALGNHEDDVSPADLRARIGEFAGVWLATNVLGLHPKTVPSQILSIGSEERRVRVGLIGVVMDDPTDYRDVPFVGATVLPCNATAESAARHLVEEEGCDAIIALTHQSIAKDRDLARSPGAAHIPLILGGHEHVPFDETVGTTRILKAGTDATHAFIVDVVWPPVGAPRIDARLEAVAAFPDDPDLRVRVDLHARLVADLKNATLMHLHEGTELSSVGSRRSQTSIGTLVCSRLRDALSADAAILNGGAIRGGRTYTGRFTYADLQAEVPFENEVVVVAMPGRVLADAILSSRRRLETGGFLQVDDRVVVRDGEVLEVAGAPIEADRAYRVAVVRNLLDGMDHIEPLVAFARSVPMPSPGSGRGVKVVLVEAFSRALLAELGGRAALDKNRDGTVEPSEIAAALADASRESASPITVDLLLRALR